MTCNAYNLYPLGNFPTSFEVVGHGSALSPKSMNMTARAKRVVWTVPGAASDPPGNAAGRLCPSATQRLSSVVFERREGER